jgi:hypothetical protein
LFGLALVALGFFLSLGCATAPRTEEHVSLAPAADVPPCAPPSIREGELLLPAGTAIPLRLEENATSFHTSVGDSLPFGVAEDVRAGETIVVPRGLPVEGFVSNAKPGSSDRTAGVLGVEIRRLDLPDGRTVPLKGILASVASPRGAQQILVGLPENWKTTPWAAEQGSPSFVPLVISLFALVSAQTLQGGEAWLLQGMIAAAQVRCDTAVLEAAPPASKAPEPQPAGSALTASGEPIVVPLNGRLTGEWRVQLETSTRPRQVRIASIASRPPPHVIGSSRIASRGSGQEVRFPAWSIVRFAALDPSAPVAVPVVLEGILADGSSFFSELTVSIQLARP